MFSSFRGSYNQGRFTFFSLPYRKINAQPFFIYVSSTKLAFSHVQVRLTIKGGL